MAFRLRDFGCCVFLSLTGTWTFYIGLFFVIPTGAAFLAAKRRDQPERFLLASFQPNRFGIYLPASMAASSNRFFPASYIVPSIASR